MNTMKLEIPPIELNWSDWIEWERFERDARSDPKAANVPAESGVYEVRRSGERERLHIGRAAKLRARIKQGLVKNRSHSTAKRIHPGEDVYDLEIRWAVCDRPSVAEEELHRRYEREWGRMPLYTRST